MLMFWSKRTVLTRRLLKAKVRGEHETECEAQEDSSSRTYHRTSSSNTSGGAVVYDSNDSRATSTTTAATTITTTPPPPPPPLPPPPPGGRQVSRTEGSGAVVYGSRNTSRLHQGCCGGGHVSQDDDEQQQHEQQRRYYDNPARLLRVKELLKTLKENQLEMLLVAVESSGADLGSCVLVPRQQRSPADDYPMYEQQQQQQQQQHDQNYHGRPHRHHGRHGFQHHRYRRYRRRSSRHHRSSSVEDEQESCCSASEDSLSASPMRTDRCCGKTSVVVPATRGPTEGRRRCNDPHLLCCQIWRWPDLEHSSELKRLPICHSAKDPVYVCCNPYHYSRLCKLETPPPPYCLIADRLRPEGETGQREWCTLAYWELGGRVGRLYPVEPLTVNVFDSLHDGDGLCLATLTENHNAPPAVQRTRSKIGLGLTLSQEADGVWAYNRSESPIFVHSPTLDEPESRTLLVYRVPSGFCLNIFDRAKILQLPYNGGGSGGVGGGCQTAGFAASGPVDINSVRISFVKGWGPNYSRQEVTSCPCWLEVLLAPCR
ncbi:dwarfin sma-3-like isoform X2 [Nylanderia fulva]|uniref:dwarfin sma-3-like isoform X2 n=1 Tax=Nylanderia fulva TaxID=613905 RepID=UPI0010FB1443|nr:dwarfin sma-3-like isoform X2 [Nylanderia fulva]